MKLVMTALRRTMLAWIALTIVLAGMSGTVLCIGSDGHWALETAHEGHCHHAEESHEHGHTSPVGLLTEGEDDGCEDCIDVPLSPDTMSQPISQVRHGLSQTKDLDNVLAASSAKALIEPDIRAGPHLGPALTPIPPPALLALRTIVLLI